jgi:hypothetical protein
MKELSDNEFVAYLWGDLFLLGVGVTLLLILFHTLKR